MLTADLTTIKGYLRITHTVDDTYLTDLIGLSKKYIEQMTGVEYSANDEVFNQAVIMCVEHFYDNRESVSEKAVSEMPFTLNSLVKHIGARGTLETETETATETQTQVETVTETET